MMRRLKVLRRRWRAGWQDFRNLRPLLRELVDRERHSRAAAHVDVRRRMACWRHGFLGEAAVLYDFEHHPPSDFLSDYARFTRNRINGPYTALLNNKVMFASVMRPFGACLPRTRAAQVRGRFQCLASQEAIRTHADIVKRVQAGQDLVVKPVAGSGGCGVAFLSSRDGKLLRNDQPVDPAQLEAELGQWDGYVVQDRIEQADYSAEIFPYTSNTLRILTIWDPEDEAPFIAAAVHRFGSEQSRPVDNWTRGGLSAAVDPQSGTLSRAVAYPVSGQLEWLSHHPDSGSRIESIVVPDWLNLRRKILEIAAALPFWSYVGWDVLIDRSGDIKILEGNSRSDVNLLQVHGPLLADERVRAFFAKVCGARH